MTQIKQAYELVSGICGKQNINNKKYRFSYHCLRVSFEEGELLYHNLTGELLLLQVGESVDDVRDELIEKWFLVPEDFDEYKFAKQVKHVAGLLTSETEGIDSFLIFTTTDCNARCSYCYELGRKRQNMSDEVAHDVVAFIQKNYSGQEIQLRWFGGEPLFNRRAIEIITLKLKDMGIPFHSQMTTNGYLFDADTVKKAVSEWNLDSVQITLDGTEDVYNRRKAYIHREGSPYQRVLGNISLLAGAGVNVSIRLNMDERNFKDLMILADELVERFRNEEHVRVYAALLRDFNNPQNNSGNGTEQISRYEQLRQKLKDLGIAKQSLLKEKIRLHRCMADRDQSITILPDGRLGKCEHESEEKLIGSIYSDVLDQNWIDKWKETISIPECRTCVQFPTCVKLKECAWNAGGCTEPDRMLMRSILTDRILNTYEKYKGEMIG